MAAQGSRTRLGAVFSRSLHGYRRQGYPNGGCFAAGPALNIAPDGYRRPLPCAHARARMSVIDQALLAESLGKLDAGTRALLDLSLRRAIPDDQVAQVLGVDAASIRRVAHAASRSSRT